MKLHSETFSLSVWNGSNSCYRRGQRNGPKQFVFAECSVGTIVWLSIIPILFLRKVSHSVLTIGTHANRFKALLAEFLQTILEIVYEKVLVLLVGIKKTYVSKNSYESDHKYKEQYNKYSSRITKPQVCSRNNKVHNF